jgi:hypothetical protein
MLLQGHSGMWSDESFQDFVKIAALLKKDGWTTITSRQYAERLTTKAAAPEKK